MKKILNAKKTNHIEKKAFPVPSAAESNFKTLQTTSIDFITEINLPENFMASITLDWKEI